MKEQAVKYYRQGYNCSQCILKAAEYAYGVAIPKQCYNMCRGINTGFGIGGTCSVLMAGVMVFGLFFDDATVKRPRMKLLSAFKDLYPCLSCAELVKERKNGAKCEKIVWHIAGLVKQIIDEERSC